MLHYIVFLYLIFAFMFVFSSTGLRRPRCWVMTSYRWIWHCSRPSLYTKFIRFFVDGGECISKHDDTHCWVTHDSHKAASGYVKWSWFVMVWPLTASAAWSRLDIRLVNINRQLVFSVQSVSVWCCVAFLWRVCDSKLDVFRFWTVKSNKAGSSNTSCDRQVKQFWPWGRQDLKCANF